MNDDELRLRVRVIGNILIIVGGSLLIVDQLGVLWKQLTGVP